MTGLDPTGQDKKNHKAPSTGGAKPKGGNMKKASIALFVILLAGCAGGTLYPNAQQNMQAQGPRIGMTEQTLYDMWGHGRDSDYYTSAYGSIKTTWYTRTMFGVLPGYQSSGIGVFSRVLVTIKDGVVTNISYH